MHTFSETGAGVPAFLAKLWRLVDDSETDNLICWSKDGRSFIIQNQAQFARDLLPLNYKHNNMASFIRQLNMYGFHKITSIDNGGLKFDRDEMEFSHPCFKRNCSYLLEHIKRKIANTKSLDDKAALKPEAVTKVLQDVKVMRGRQDSLDSRFSVMKQENEALWREIASLRQKHAKQQQIVNKLIQFLITIVQPSRNMTSVKRHMQLMINDTPDSAKLRTTSESESDCGPVIHELGEELLDEVADNDLDLIDAHSPYVKLATAHLDTDSPSPLNMERPHSSISIQSQNYDYSNQSVEDVLNMAAASSPAIGNGTNSNAEATHIIYHVTEVPDAQISHEAITGVLSPSYGDENVLTTPMVREQMARTQLLKQKNKQRRQQADIDASIVLDSIATNSPKSVKLQHRISNQQQPTATGVLEQLQIKSEQQEMDPMSYINVFNDNIINNIEPAQPIISPNLSENSRQSSASNGNVAPSNTTTTNERLMKGTRTPDLYNPNSFITSDMPADLFEDSSLMSAGDNSNLGDSFKLNQQQQQFGRSTAAGGKFSSFIAANNGSSNSNSANGASTSAAAAAAAAAASSSVSTSEKGGRNGKNMAVTKYNKNGTKIEENLRDEVHGHLDNMQDELESLKDLLRGDGYSLDANTLLGNGQAATLNNNRIYLSPALDGDFFNKLFNDSDILGPYGLGFSGENSNDKKGSELMTYQPMYDLSDIIDCNDKSDLDAAEADNTSNVPSSSRQQLQTQSSVLNTPRHE